MRPTLHPSHAVTGDFVLGFDGCNA